MSFKSNQRPNWTPSVGNPEGQRIGTPGDLFYSEAEDTLWIKAFGRQTKTGWRPLQFTAGGSSSSAQAALETDGGGGFSSLVTVGFSSVTLSAPRNVNFAFETPRPNANYTVIPNGSEGSSGGLFTNVQSKTINGFTLFLFDNSNAAVNPLVANVIIDVLVTQMIT